jgi:hypothetical protein
MPIDRLAAQEATDLVRHCLEEGEITWGPHFRNALQEESFGIEEVFDVLQHETSTTHRNQTSELGSGSTRLKAISRTVNGSLSSSALRQRTGHS